MTDLSESGQAGATETEITAEMIESGLCAWRDWEYSDEPSPTKLVASVYLAMKKAAVCEKSHPDR